MKDKRIKKEELSDEQIQNLIEDFINLTDEDRKSRFLGQGAYKDVYSIPDTNFVLKIPKNTEAGLNDMAREYVVNKAFGKDVDLEPPVLISRKGEGGKIDPYHIQRRIMPLETVLKSERESFNKSPMISGLKEEIKQLENNRSTLLDLKKKALEKGDVKEADAINKKYLKTFDDAFDIRQKVALLEKEKIDSKSNALLDDLYSKMESKGIIGSDIHEGNVTPEGKVFDLGSWTSYADDDKNRTLNKIRKNLVDRTIKSPQFKSKYGIFRSLMPMLAKGAIASAGGIASLAAEAADSEEEGSLRQEKAMQREREQRKFRENVGEDVANELEENMQKFGPKDLLFRNLRSKLK